MYWCVRSLCSYSCFIAFFPVVGLIFYVYIDAVINWFFEVGGKKFSRGGSPLADGWLYILFFSDVLLYYSVFIAFFTVLGLVFYVYSSHCFCANKRDWSQSRLKAKSTLQNNTFDVLVSTFLDVWSGVLMSTTKIFHREGWSNAPCETRDGNERPSLRVLLDHPLGCYKTTPWVGCSCPPQKYSILKGGVTHPCKTRGGYERPPLRVLLRTLFKLQCSVHTAT